MKIKDGAKVFIKNDRLGKYLFQLRDNKPTIPNPNTYGLVGGGIEAEEVPIEALKRELEEETNLTVSNIESLGNKEVTNVMKEEGEQLVKSRLYVFLAHTEKELEDIVLNEGQKLAYFTIDEALNLPNLSPPIREVIDEYREKLS
ncbi:MAG: NUDIX domain-containing protein [Candidatus Pacebacteria bacterium]|nr:NUDIX domain-containing protein [Candidatus Paceibacterota bacterium]